MITAVSDQFPRPSKKMNLQDFEIVYSKLNRFIDHLDHKIIDRLQLVKHVYAEEYASQVKVMTQELQAMRGCIEQQILKEKFDETRILLEQERNFFRSQVLQLDIQLQKMIKENKEMKSTIQSLKIELSTYHKISVSNTQRLHKMALETQDAFKRDVEFSREKQTQQHVQAQVENQANCIKVKQQSDKIMQKASSSTRMTTYTLEKKNNPKSARILSHSDRKYSATRLSIVKYEQNSVRNAILDECIFEIKKQIYARKLKKEDYFSEDIAKISIQSFTATDRRRLMEAILSNQSILNEFRLFMQQNIGKPKEKVRRRDEEYNSRTLSHIKAKFNQRIIKIRASPIDLLSKHF